MRKFIKHFMWFIVISRILRKFSRAMDSFVGLLSDIGVITHLKKAFVDAFTNAIERALYGGKKPPVVNHEENSKASNKHDIILTTQKDAERVLEALCGMIDNFDFVTVGDLNELVGLSTTKTDFMHGWTSLTDAKIESIEAGFVLKFPTPISLITKTFARKDYIRYNET